MTASRPGDLILHVLDHALPELSGYSVRSHQLLRALQGAGFRVAAVTSSSRKSVPVEDVLDGVRYIRLPFRREGAAQTASVVWRRVVRFGHWLTTEIDYRGVGVLHAHSPVLTALPALWAARRRGRPLVYEVRGFWEDAVLDRELRLEPDLRYRVTRALESAVLRRADAVTTISQGLRSEIVGRGVPQERVHVAPNGVDAAAFGPRAADAALLAEHGLGERFVVGYLGYFFAYEGVVDLIRAFARMLQRTPRARLLLVGTGEGEAVLRDEVKRLGVAAAVIFAGQVPHGEIGRYYSLCSVVVYPRLSRRSTEVTTPLKPLEAMAMAKPVIASAVGGLRELVRDGDSGLLYPPGDVNRLGDLLVSVATDAALGIRLGTNARRFVAEERRWECAAEKYAEVYGGLLRAPHPGER